MPMTKTRMKTTGMKEPFGVQREDIPGGVRDS
jgi:hypothetical protein